MAPKIKFWSFGFAVALVIIISLVSFLWFLNDEEYCVPHGPPGHYRQAPRVGITFVEPQPAETPDEANIPAKLVGTYLSLLDSTELFITGTMIIRLTEQSVRYRITPTVLERLNLKDLITRDTSFLGTAPQMPGGEKVRYRVSVKGDSLEVKMSLIDTLCNFLAGDRIRKSGKYYLLSREVWPQRWGVEKLGLTKEGVIRGEISGASYENNLKDLRSLTHTETDSVYQFTMTLRQMNAFMNEGGFGGEELFVKKGSKKNGAKAPSF
jgi:hypothetical protein